MADEMVGETTVWSRLPHYATAVFMTCHYYEPNPSLLTPFNKIIPQTASLLSNAFIETVPERTVNQNFHFRYLYYDVLLFELIGLCRDGLTASYKIHHPLKCPTLPFGSSCNLRDGQGILL